MAIKAMPIGSDSYGNVEKVLLADGREVDRIYGRYGSTYHKIYDANAAIIYGIHLLPTSSGYDITYLNDAVNKAPAYMDFTQDEFNYGDWENAFFMPRPCMLKYDGTVDYYLDPNNYNLKDEGTDPAGYKFVEYLETTGTQYIDTDIYVSSYTDFAVDMKVYFDSSKTASPAATFFGTLDSGNVRFLANTDTYKNGCTHFWSGFQYQVNTNTDWLYYVRPWTLDKTAYYHFKLSDYNCNGTSGVLAINGVEKSSSYKPTVLATELPSLPLRIFGLNRSDTSSTVYQYAGLRIYNFIVTEKVNNIDTVTHSLLPAERQSDGALGLYDTITNVFYVGSGTGTFLKGAYGESSDVDNVTYQGNAMMEWPKIWYKFEAGETDGEGYFYCSDTKVDDSFHCWCNYDILDNEIDHFYTPIYNGIIFDGKLRSLSSVTIGDTSPDLKTFINAARTNNTTANTEWDLEIFADKQLITALLVLISKSLDFKSSFGYGLSAQSSSASTTTYKNGSVCNDKGLFWGDTETGSNPVKVFGMENPWGYRLRGTVGVHVNGNVMYYKLTAGQIDGSTTTGYKENAWISTNWVCSDYKQIEGHTTGSGLIKTISFTNDCYYISDCYSTAPSSSVYTARYYHPDNNTVGFWYGCAAIDALDTIGINASSLNTTSIYNGASISCKPIAAESIPPTDPGTVT